MIKAPDETRAAEIGPIDVVLEWLVVALLVFAPLAFGGVEPWSELVVISLAAAMAVGLALRQIIQPGSRLVWSWAYVPMVLFVAVVALQLITLPYGWIRAVSPNTASTRTALLGDMPQADQVLSAFTLSFYPLATRHALSIVLAICVTFVVVLNVFRRPDQICRLLGAIAIIGAAVACLSLVQTLSGTDNIYWLVPSGADAARSGPFVNHNHYGQFMALSIGAALGLLLVKTHVASRSADSASGGGMSDVWMQLTDPRTRLAWSLVAMIILGVATVFLSLTRMGSLSLVIAGGLTAALVLRKRILKGRAGPLALVAAGAFLCVLCLGFDVVYDRMATLRDPARFGDRWQILKDVGVAVSQFPVAGTGLGTHEVVYPMFGRSLGPDLPAFAENEYAQTAEETGIAGLAVVLIFVGIVWASYVRCVRRTGPPIALAAIGLGFGLLAVMIQCASDFGQHVPANAVLAAVTAALLIRLGRMAGGAERKVTGEAHGCHSERAQRVEESRRDRSCGTRPTARFLASLGMTTRIAGLVGVAVVSAWALWGAVDAARAASHAEAARQIEDRLADKNWAGTTEEYAEAIQEAAAAVDCEPGNVEYRYWLGVYRWQSLHAGSTVRADDGRMDPEALGLARRVVEDLHAARPLCPTYAPVCCVAGQIEQFVLGRGEGADHIRMAASMAPSDIIACYAAGVLAVREGRSEDSLGDFRRCLALEPGLMGNILRLYIDGMHRPDLAIAAASDSPDDLLRISESLRADGLHEDAAPRSLGAHALAAEARAQAARLLKGRSARADASKSTLALLASVAYEDGDYATAVASYRRALALDYDRLEWRLGLARALARTGRVTEATHEAEVALRLRPNSEDAESLIEELAALTDGATGP